MPFCPSLSTAKSTALKHNCIRLYDCRPATDRAINRIPLYVGSVVYAGDDCSPDRRAVGDSIIIVLVGGGESWSYSEALDIINSLLALLKMSVLTC